jgi:hypothetical protein
MRNATKTVATWPGVVAGIAGLEQGTLDFLLGHAPPPRRLGQFPVGSLFTDFLKGLMGVGLLLIMALLPLSAYGACARPPARWLGPGCTKPTVRAGCYTSTI